MRANIVDSGDLSFDSAAWDDSGGDDDAAFFGKLVKGIGKAVGGVAKTVASPVVNTANAVARTGVGRALGKVGNAWLTVAEFNPLIKGATTLGKGVASGKRIDKAMVDSGRAWLHQASQSVGFVPGVGQTIGPALGAADALANGKPITQAVIAGVRSALPGGPIAQRAFDAGAAAVITLSKGGTLSQAALDAARSQLPDGAAKAAFDAGVAVVRGQKLQQVAMGAAVGLAGEALGKSGALDAVSKMQSAITSGKTIGQITNAIQSAALSPQAKSLANTLLQRPELRGLNVSQLAQQLGQSPAVVREAIGSVAESARKVAMGAAPTLGKSVIAKAIGAGDSLDSALSRFGSAAASPHLGPRPQLRNQARRIASRLRVTNAMGLDDASGIDRASKDYVRWYQLALNQVAGERLGTDGIRGPLTVAAVKRFQTSKRLGADGIVGPATETALIAAGAPLPPGASAATATPVAPAPAFSLPSLTTAAANVVAPPMSRTSPEYIRWYQSALNQVARERLDTDGKRGPLTIAAVKRFQTSKRLGADGIVGPATEAALIFAGAPRPPGASAASPPPASPAPAAFSFPVPGLVPPFQSSPVQTLPEVTIFGTPPAPQSPFPSFPTPATANAPIVQTPPTPFFASTAPTPFLTPGAPAAAPGATPAAAAQAPAAAASGGPSSSTILIAGGIAAALLLMGTGGGSK